jgi:hypothetical protein
MVYIRSEHGQLGSRGVLDPVQVRAYYPSIRKLELPECIGLSYFKTLP